MGNARFLSNRRRAPAFAEQGMHGDEHWFNLELKLVADVALVGFPNVGKSTLIATRLGGQAEDRRLSLHHADPQPRRREGGLELDRTEFVMADIPGLIEGAAEGADSATSSSATSSAPACCASCSTWPRARGASPEAQLAVLLDELGRYEPALLERPRLVIGSRPIWPRTHEAAGVELEISSVTRRGPRPARGWPGDHGGSRSGCRGRGRAPRDHDPPARPRSWSTSSGPTTAPSWWSARRPSGRSASTTSRTTARSTRRFAGWRSSAWTAC